MSSQAGSRASLAQLSSPRAGGRVPHDRADPRAESPSRRCKPWQGCDRFESCPLRSGDAGPAPAPHARATARHPRAVIPRRITGADCANPLSSSVVGSTPVMAGGPESRTRANASSLMRISPACAAPAAGRQDWSWARARSRWRRRRCGRRSPGRLRCPRASPGPTWPCYQPARSPPLDDGVAERGAARCPREVAQLGGEPAKQSTARSLVQLGCHLPVG
jgi:hypothetical protein